MVWTFERDRATAKLVCNEENCQHRYVCKKGCESLFLIEPDGDGFRHAVNEYEDGRVSVWHVMEHGGDCNFVLFVNEDDSEELCADRATFEIGRVAVEPVWSEDGAEWKPVIS